MAGLPYNASELVGSPQENWSTKDGFSGQREFLVPWDYRFDFIEEFLGLRVGATTAQVNYPGRLYPGVANTVAISASSSPFETVNSNLDLISSEIGVARYQNAKVTIQYGTVFVNESGATGLNPPEIPNDTYAQIEVESGVKVQYFKTRGNWTWGSDSKEPPGETPVPRVIGTGTVNLSWLYVRNPDWVTLNKYRGHVNSTAIMGYSAEQLLYTGFRASRMFQVRQEAENALWRIDLRFGVETKIGVESDVVGWNHIPRDDEDKSGFDAVERVGTLDLLYPSVDFNVFFVPL